MFQLESQPIEDLGRSYDYPDPIDLLLELKKSSELRNVWVNHLLHEQQRMERDDKIRHPQPPPRLTLLAPYLAELVARGGVDCGKAAAPAGGGAVAAPPGDLPTGSPK